MKEFDKYYPGPYRVDDSSGWVIGTPEDGTYIHCFDWEDSSFTDKYEPTEIQELWLRKIKTTLLKKDGQIMNTTILYL